ncbi:MAG: alpha/beta fold hydrolase [Candidatus Heimdallarchaeota archaeon]|nr:alpha/beta fold hydrolase [Candidatus Heimdallarchaeota archaeon]
MNKTILRTPDERFTDLPDYPFEPNYVTINGLRIHYVDEGPKDGKQILLLHGEPTWSYLYRKMIPPLAEKGYRVIAPDLVGFGKTDKFALRKDHTYDLHVEVMTKFVEALNLAEINLFIHDWGGLIGLRVVHNLSDKFITIMAANTGFPRAKGFKGLFGHMVFKRKIKQIGKVTAEELWDNPTFLRWVAFSQTVEIFDIGELLQRASETELSKEELAAYDAPFPDESYKEGPRAMTMLTTSQLRLNKKVWDTTFKTWNKQFMTAFSDKDPITRGGERTFKRDIPGARDINHPIIMNAGHFLQEDKPIELFELLTNFIEK